MNEVTSKNITQKQIVKVDENLGYDSKLSNYGYAFYYNQLFVYYNDLCDADRYANLNTIFGYDIGFIKFLDLDNWLDLHGYDSIEMNGSDKDKELLQTAIKDMNMEELDFSKWRNLSGCEYSYSYFENGEEFK